jgi:hypothetical protein
LRIDDKGVDLIELLQGSQQCSGDDSVELVFPNSSRAVGAGTLDAVPDIQSNARLGVRTRTGRDSQAIEKRVNNHPAAHLRCTKSY